MRVNILALVLVVVFLMQHSAKATSMILSWEINGLSNPESVYASHEHPWLYISNTNGKNKGFISRVSKDGRIDELKWVDGLLSPTGMGLYKNHLYVVDYKFVRVIDVKTAKVIHSITHDSVEMLNDLTISDTGQILVSDILSGKIYQVSNTELSVWFENELVPHPNGLLFLEGEVIVANLGSKLSQSPTNEEYGSAYKIILQDKAISLIAPSYKLGGLDGVVAYQNDLLISHFPAGEIYKITNKERILIGTVTPSSADIGIDKKSSMLFIPFLLKNKVAAYQLSE